MSCYVCGVVTFLTVDLYALSMNIHTNMIYKIKQKSMCGQAALNCTVQVLLRD
jgi:hypothetical protein